MVDNIDSLTSGIIELRNVHKITKSVICPMYDSRIGTYRGLPRLSEDQKKKISYIVPTEDSTFELYDGVKFNLDDEQERAIWEWVKWSDKIAYDPSSDDIHGTSDRYGVAEFYVYNGVALTEKLINKKYEITKANNFVFDSSDDKAKMVAKVLGYNTRGASASEVKEYLLDIAERKPNQITHLYTSDNLYKLNMIKEAINSGIIIHKDGVYRYGTELMGTTEDQCLVWLDNPQNDELVELLKAQLNPHYAIAQNKQALEKPVSKAKPKTTPKSNA